MTADAAAVPVSRGRAWPIALLTSRANVRQPIVYLTLAGMPISYFIVFSLIAGSTLSRQAFIGAAIAYSINGGVVSLPQTVVVYRMRQLHDMIIASPIRPATYLTGLALSRLLYVGPPLVVVLVALSLFGEMPLWRVLMVVPFVAVAWMFGCALGFAVSRRWDNPAYISSIANMVGYLLVLLPPVYYPMSLLPQGLRLPISLVPTAAIAELTRWGTGLDQPSGALVAFDMAVSLVAVVGCAWYAASDRRWREP